MTEQRSDARAGAARAYRLFDFVFSVETEDCEVAARLAEILRPFECDPGPAPKIYRLAFEPGLADDPWQVTLDGATVMGSPDRDALVEHLVWHINTKALTHAPDRVLFHAGSVVAPDGGAVLLVGASGAGKSTLVAALVRAGWGYLSDELAVIDPVQQVVEPHPRPIHLKRGSPALAPGRGEPQPGLDAWHIPVDEVRHGALCAAQPVRAIVRLDPRQGPEPTVTEVSPGAAAAALARHSLNPDDHRGALLPLARDLALAASCLALTPGDLGRSVRLLAEAIRPPAST